MNKTRNHLFRRRNGDADDLTNPDVLPVDLAAVQADETLLNTLGCPDAWLYQVNAALNTHLASTLDVEEALRRVLLAARREVDTESIGQLVDIDTAVATVSAARKSRRSRHRAIARVVAKATAYFGHKK